MFSVTQRRVFTAEDGRAYDVHMRTAKSHHGATHVLNLDVYSLDDETWTFHHQYHALPAALGAELRRMFPEHDFMVPVGAVQ